LSFADFNADGLADLAVADYDDNNVLVLLGNGDGIFRPAGSYSLESWSTFIAAGDFNGDGKADLVVSHPLGGCCSFQARGEVTILWGNGDATFRPPVDYLVGQVPENDKPECVAVADFNGDGNADLAVADGSKIQSGWSKGAWREAKGIGSNRGNTRSGGKTLTPIIARLGPRLPGVRPHSAFATGASLPSHEPLPRFQVFRAVPLPE